MCCTTVLGVLCIFVLLIEPVSFTINDLELPAITIINNITSSGPNLYRLLCVGVQGNRQLQLHATELPELSSDVMPQYTLRIQNYSATIEVTIETQSLPSLFTSILTCTSIESGENVSLILTSSEDTYIVTNISTKVTSAL